MTDVQISDSVLATPVTVTASTAKLHGQTIPETKFEYTYDELAENSAIPADEQFSHADLIGVINARRKAAARANATAELAKSLGISKPGVLDTDEGRIAAMAKVFRAAGKSEADAVALAKVALGL